MGAQTGACPFGGHYSVRSIAPGNFWGRGPFLGQVLVVATVASCAGGGGREPIGDAGSMAADTCPPQPPIDNTGCSFDTHSSCSYLDCATYGHVLAYCRGNAGQD